MIDLAAENPEVLSQLVNTLAILIPETKLTEEQLKTLLRLNPQHLIHGSDGTLLDTILSALAVQQSEVKLVEPELRTVFGHLESESQRIATSRASEKLFVTLVFTKTNRGGVRLLDNLTAGLTTTNRVKWRPITQEDIASGAANRMLSRSEVIQRQSVQGYQFSGEEPPDLASYDRTMERIKQQSERINNLLSI